MKLVRKWLNLTTVAGKLVLDAPNVAELYRKSVLQIKNVALRERAETEAFCLGQKVAIIAATHRRLSLSLPLQSFCSSSHPPRCYQAGHMTCSLSPAQPDADARRHRWRAVTPFIITQSYYMRAEGRRVKELNNNDSTHFWTQLLQANLI